MKIKIKIFILYLIIQFSALICYANSNQFSGGSFDGYDDSIFINSGSPSNIAKFNQQYGGGSYDGYDDSIFINSGSPSNIAKFNQQYGGGSYDGYDDSIFINSGSSSNIAKFNQQYGGGSYDGYSDAVLIQSSGGGVVNSKQRFSGGAFDGYDQSIFAQSGSDNKNLNYNFAGGAFDGYDNSIFVQSGSDNKNLNCCYQGGPFDGYDKNDFDYPTPFVQITNAPVFLLYSQTSAQISGTNINISGQLAWINNIFPDSTNWFDQGFDVEVDSLAEGTNTIIIIGANYLSNYVSDSITIYRETFDDVHPFIKITNAPSEVAYNIYSAEISGTNLNIAGEMWWTNSLNGAGGTVPISNFNFQVSVDYGNNLITVSGTNVYGQSTNDVVNIHRKTWIESAPQIATNALVFPASNSVVWAPYPTNIIWDVSKITDDIDGTNLTITKISVFLEKTTNEVSVVTNNINNLLGEISWLVPENLVGNETNYVLKFEVVDSESLTNSRIFWDNKFIIIPELPGILWLMTMLGTFLCKRKTLLR